MNVDTFLTPDEWKELWRISAGRLNRPLLQQVFALASEVRVTLQEFDWRKMWMWAYGMKNYEGMQFLLDQDVGVRAIANWPSMWRTAAGKNDLVTMRFILKQDIKAQDLMQPDEWRALWETAANTWRLDMIDLLAGLDLGLVCATDWTPLWRKAVATRNVDVMRLVVLQGVDIDALMGPEGWKALYFDAAHYADVKALKFVLERGLDVRAVDPKGSALDDVACQWGGSPEAVELLVEAGIELGDVEQLIAYGAHSISAAGEAQNHNRIARYLREKAAQKSASAKIGDRKLLRALGGHSERI